LEISIEDAADSVAKGIETGVKAGLASGAKEGIKPLAQKAAEEAVANITSGGSGGMQTAIKNIMDLQQAQATQLLVDSWKNKQTNQQAQAQTPPPIGGNKFKDVMNTLISFGYDPQEIFKEFDKKTLMMMAMNPDLIPMLVMNGKQEERGSNKLDNMMPFFMMNMQRNQQPTVQQAPTEKGGETITAIATMFQAQMQTQAQMFQQMMQMQQQAADEKMQLMVKAMQPYMEHRTFAEELGELNTKFEGLKSLGLLQQQTGRSPQEAQLDFEAKRMSMELKKEELKQQIEERTEERKVKMQEKQMDQWGKILGFGRKIVKNLNLNPAPSEEQAPATVGTTMEQKPLGKNISARITSLLKKAQDAIPDDDAGDDTE
jgi:hypothetical protein